MSRSGMANLIDRLRDMVDDGSATVFNNDQLQVILDANKLRVQRENLERERTNTSGTAYVFKTFHSRFRDFEEGGTAYFNLEDSGGSQRVPSTDYAVDYVGGVVTMTADQGGTGLFLTGWSYDLAGAAAQAWMQRAGKVSSYYNVNVDGHQMSRSQWFDHCERMEQLWASRSRPITVRAWRHGVFDDN